MSKTLQMILSLLRTQSVSTTSIVALLQTDNTASTLGISALLGTLSSSKDEYLSSDIVDHLTKVVELTLNEMKEKAEDALNSLIVTNSFNHYQEVVTTQGEDLGNQSIISEYSGKISDQSLEYYAFIPPTPEPRFTIGELTFDINPDSEFSFQTADGSKKSASYKFRVKVTNVSDPVGVKNRFANFKIEAFYHVIGMSFLKSKYVSVTHHSDEIIMMIDTYPFYRELAEKYNVYYSNIRAKESLKLSDIASIDCCHFDENGPILVPKLFYLSSIYTDGDIGTRPFIYDTDTAQLPVELNQNPYRISLTYSKSISDAEAERSVNFLISKISEFGVILYPKGGNFAEGLKRGDVNNTLTLSIGGYEKFSEDGGDYQTSYSAKLAYESKVSACFRKLCQLGFLGPNDYSIRGGSTTQGTEKYCFIPNASGIEANYDYKASKFIIFFNRSAFTLSKIKDDNSSILTSMISERNGLKFRFTETMLARLEENGQTIEYNGQMWPNIFSDYIPTSFIPISFSRRDRAKGANDLFTGVSFIPFGFSRFVSTDINISAADGGFSIYGSDFQMIKAHVNKVIKLSTDPNEIPNVVQIIVESSDVPKHSGDLPLKISKLDDTHFLLLYRSTSKFSFDSDIVWSYASSYVQNTSQLHEKEMSTTTSLKFLFTNDQLLISCSAVLRYLIEVIILENDFIDFVSKRSKELFNGTTDLISIRDFLSPIVSGEITISSVPKKFFELLDEALVDGVINDSVLNWIVTVVKTSNCEIVCNFLRSILKPVKNSEYPTYTADMQMSLTKTFNDEINEITDKIYSVADSLVDKSALDIKSLATSHEGLLRTLINMMAEKVEKAGTQVTKELIVEVKNSCIKILKDLVKEPILPNLVGLKIVPQTIIDASNELHMEIFVRWMKLLYAELNSSDYSDHIIDMCKRVTSEDEVFNVSPISQYEYSVSFNVVNRDSLLELNETSDERTGLFLNVFDSNNHVQEFGEQIFDTNIHCMFSVDYDRHLNLSDVILEALHSGKIYYTQVGDIYTLRDLNVVSIYGTSVDTENPSLIRIHFFLPFVNNGGRITVESKEWTMDSSVFSLCNKTVELEIITDYAKDKVDTIKKLIYTRILDISKDNVVGIRSVCLGLEPVKRSYILEDRTSHFFMTEDLRDDLKSGEYTNEFGDVDSSIWEEIPSLKLSIFIYPVSSVVCKFHLLTTATTFRDSMKTVGKILGLSAKKTTESFTEFINNYESQMSVSYSKQISDNDEVLITRSKQGIFTQSIMNRDVESEMASSVSTYHKMVEFKMDGIDELTDLDRAIIQDKVDIENEKLRYENSIHNLSLILSNIRWNSITVDNYKFYSNEKPKWMKFSPDSYFMAVAFQSGIKIYIRSGTQYVFCCNLPHEGVKDIIFGNSQFCITIQNDDSSRPYGLLWITATGNLFNFPIKYYIPTNEDAVNIKYIAVNTAKEKKNVLLTVEGGIMKYQDSIVQSATPIFDHNVYFFSPNDKNLILNSSDGGRGGFRCYNLSNLSLIEFKSINGISIDSGTSLPKCIETGSWINDNIFIGVTYSAKNPLLKLRVTINVEQQSIIQSDILAEFPLSSIAENMYVRETSEVHPLYSFLMDQRKKYLDDLSSTNFQTGVWIHDTYISLTVKRDKKFLTFTSTDGYYDSYEVNIDLPDGDNSFGRANTITNLLQIFEYSVFIDSVGIHIGTIEWLGKLIYSRYNASRTTDGVFLQVYNGNYFNFYGDSVYSWRYITNSSGDRSTELVHIDSEGYAKYTFDDHVILLVTDSIKCCLIIDGFLIDKVINVSKDISYGAKAEQISEIVEEIREKHSTSVLFYTEQSIENYSGNVDSIPVNIDSKPISSRLCLNRFDDFKLGAHIETPSNSERAFIHDNLLLLIEGNTVKIVPRTVQLPNSLDGFTNEWYKTHSEDTPEYWQMKKDSIDKYLNDVKQIAPQISKISSPYVNFDLLREIFRVRVASTIDLGYEMALEKGISPEIISVVKFIFDLFGSTKCIYSKDNILEEINEYWKKPSNYNRKIAAHLKNFEGTSKYYEYDRIISILSVMYGNIFISSVVGRAFSMLSSQQFEEGRGSYKRAKTVDEVKKIFSSQLNVVTEDHDVRTLNFILLVLNIPLPSVKIVQIVSFNDFSNRLFTVRDESARISKMISSSSKFEQFRFLELSDLKSKCDDFITKSFIYGHRSLPDQVDTDYITSLNIKFERIETPPEKIIFDDEGVCKLDETYYFDSGEDDQGNHRYLKISEPLYNFSKFRHVFLEFKDFLLNFLKDDRIKRIFSEEFDLIKLSKLLGRREFKKPEDDAIIGFASIIDMVSIKSLVPDNNQAENNLVRIAKTKFGEDIEFLISHGKKFGSINDFSSYINSCYEERYPDSLYGLFGDEVPELLNEVISTYNVDLNNNCDQRLLDVNIPYIDKMLKFYQNCLKRGYYVSNGTYANTKSLDDIMIPLLWKYRNGCSDERRQISVTSLKFIFPRPVRYKKTSDFVFNETKDITFEYEMPEDDVKHNSKYGTVSINLLDVLSSLYSKRDTKSLSHIKEYVNGSFEELEIATDKGVINKEKCLQLVKSLFPPIDKIFENKSQYFDGFESLYSFVTLKKSGITDDSKFAVDFYKKMSYFYSFDLDLEYNFDYRYAAVDFGEKKVNLSYMSKVTKKITDKIVFDKQSIACGILRPYFYLPKLILDKEGNIAIFRRPGSGIEFIVYYGVTVREGINTAFIVTQDLVDRSQKTYIYTSSYKNFGKVIPIPTFFVSLEYNKVDENITIVEKVFEERHEKGVGFVKFETSSTKSTSIESMLTKFTEIPNMTIEKYEEAVVTSNFIKTKNNVTIIVSNYKAGFHYGTSMDVFVTKSGRTTKVKSYNFYMFQLKEFDFNKKHVVLVGYTSTVNGLSVKIGVMDLQKMTNSNDINDVKPQFVTSFDREIKLSNNFVEVLDNVTCNAGPFNCNNNGTTIYVTYKGKTLNHLVIFNNVNVYETKFVSDITSVNVSKGCGFVSLYFKNEDKSEIWLCNGSLYKTVEGECNWM